MHHVFDSPSDPFIFDVSHQAYAHKLLTDRWDRFETLRQFGGISGFAKPSESPYDYFIAGHSSTSISAAVGAAKAIALNGESRIPVVLIGDGSMTAGMVYEALNELGHRKYPMVIIINDNEMSIAKPIGAISEYLSKALSTQTYQRFKGRVENALHSLPGWIDYLMRRFERGFKLITPGIIFEELGLDYIGPVNGHDLLDLTQTLQMAKQMGKPVVVHVQTTKGRGYEIAEGRHEKWHGVGPFDLSTGEAKKAAASQQSPTSLFAQTLLQLANENDKICGVTAAMPSGTGLDKLMDAYPQRFWDVAICEQHAVTSMAALAKEGFRPFVAVYSTFLQRAFDQIVHDVCLQKLPVIFAIDRAGIVGEDGETHQGAFDVAFLRCLPNITLFAPRDNDTLQDAIRYAVTLDVPCAFRYPRGEFLQAARYPSDGFSTGKLEMLESGEELLLIGYGNGVNRALATALVLRENGKNAAVADLRFLKPLDHEGLLRLAKKHQKWFVFSDNSKMGGVCEALALLLSENGISSVQLNSLEFEDSFITHGKTAEVEESLGLTAKKMSEKIINNS